MPRVARGLMAVSVLGCVGLVGREAVATVGMGSAPKMHRSQASVGYTLAHQFLTDRKERNGRILLLFPPDQAAPAAALDSFYEAFARVMTRFPGVEVREKLVDVSKSKLRRGQVSLEAFSTALEVDEKTLALVSWVGFPHGAEDLPQLKDGSRRPAVYVYDPSGSTWWMEHVTAGVIQGGVIEKEEPDGGGQPGMAPNPAAVFAERYRLVTAEN